MTKNTQSQNSQYQRIYYSMIFLKVVWDVENSKWGDAGASRRAVATTWSSHFAACVPLFIVIVVDRCHSWIDHEISDLSMSKVSTLDEVLSLAVVVKFFKIKIFFYNLVVRVYLIINILVEDNLLFIYFWYFLNLFIYHIFYFIKSKLFNLNLIK